MGKPGTGSSEEVWPPTSGQLSILVWGGSCRETDTFRLRTGPQERDQQLFHSKSPHRAFTVKRLQETGSAVLI